MRTHRYAVILLSSICFASISAFSQDKADIKFGKVSQQDFDLSKYSFDTTAGAVYIADIGNCKFRGNNKGWFTLVFKRQYRLKILSPKGFQLATGAIPVYQKDGEEEVVDDLKATTYNLENGQVSVARLDKKSIFNDKIGGHWKLKKFTLPGVKVGSIIEVSYTIESDFLFQLKPWNFQREYPILWSEYNAEIPDIFNYLFLQQGYQKFHINSTKVSMENFLVKQGYGANASSNVSVSTGLTTLRWVMKDVPPMKEEKFTTTTENYTSKIEFQLSQIRLQQPPEDVLGNWFKTSSILMKHQSFGKELNEDSSWLDKDIEKIVGDASTPIEKSKKIHAFVRDYFTCTDYDIYLSKSLRDVFKEKHGNVADLNLLLVLMLRHEGIDASPILLSTRAHGFSHPFHPMLDKYNYVVVKASIGGTDYYLDASEPRLGFNYLPLRCYNGDARLIGKLPIPVFFYADSVRERTETNVVIRNGGKGRLTGQVNSVRPYYESFDLRTQIAKNGKDEYFKSIAVGYPADNYALSEFSIDSIDDLEEPVRLRYSVDINLSDQSDVVYFNPMLGEGHKDNYFKATTRKYPVEMPYVTDESYQLTMEIPTGYVVEELPGSGKHSLKEGGFFEYATEKKGNTIRVRSHLVIDKANFKPEEYDGLRRLFDFIVKKHNEQIVFKKN